MIQNISTIIPSFAWIITGGIILTLADIIFIYYINSQTTTSYLVTSFILYMVGQIFLCLSYFGEDIAQASIAIVLVNVLSLIFVNFFIFGKHLSALGYFGVFLGLVAFIILEFYS